MLDYSQLFKQDQSIQEEKKQTNPNNTIEKKQHIFYLQEKRNILDKAKEVYKNYQDNIKKAEILQSEILKGIATGESTETLFIKAIDTIGILTNNKAFIDQARKDIYDIQADIFQNNKFLEVKLLDLTNRKEKLVEVLEKTEDDVRKRNISKNIRTLDIEIIKTLKLVER